MMGRTRSLVCGGSLLVLLGACTLEEGPLDDEANAVDDDGVAVGDGGGSADTVAVGAGAGTAGTGGADSTGAGGPGQGGGGDAPCPEGMICVSSFPFVHVGDTTSSSVDAFDVYSCSDQNESGPEVVYRLDVPTEGFLTVTLPEAAMGAGVDIDVHLLGSLDAGDCLDRGHWQVGELLPAGTYYLVADTWVDGDGMAYPGAYTLEVGLLTRDHLTGWGMSSAVASDTLTVLDSAWSQGFVETDAFAVVDFAMHASEKRMWLFDTFQATLAFHTYTTVGEASDPNRDGWADVFSNIPESHQSSLGLMRASEAYSGDYGKSVRLDGLEPGYNDAVRGRAIVIHPWYGSAPSYVAENPSVGTAHSWGCLGIDPDIGEPVRDYLAGGGLVLSHFVDGDWSANSMFLE